MQAQPVASAVQFVTSKPSDVETNVSSNLDAVTRTGKFYHIMPNKWIMIIICRGYTKFDFPFDEGKGRLNPSRDTERCSLTSRINGITIHTHNRHTPKQRHKHTMEMVQYSVVMGYLV